MPKIIKTIKADSLLGGNEINYYDEYKGWHFYRILQRESNRDINL